MYISSYWCIQASTFVKLNPFGKQPGKFPPTLFFGVMDLLQQYLVNDDHIRYPAGHNSKESDRLWGI